MDVSLTQHLTGLTNVGHSSEWEAGIPIDWKLMEISMSYIGSAQRDTKGFCGIE